MCEGTSSQVALIMFWTSTSQFHVFMESHLTIKGSHFQETIARHNRPSIALQMPDARMGNIPKQNPNIYSEFYIGETFMSLRSQYLRIYVEYFDIFSCCRWGGRH